jgi:uncharacterized membrane protein
MYTLSVTKGAVPKLFGPQLSIYQSFLPMAPLLTILSISSLMSVTMLIARFWYSGHTTFKFLVWNLFLAWIPLFCALALWHYGQQMRKPLLRMVLLFLGWLIFFPNAPYLMTDFLHLGQRHNIPLWYDLILIFSFAWNGLVVGFTALWIVQAVTQKFYGQGVSWLVVGFTLITSGFGVYLGRFLRWNSWDVLTDPYGLARDVLPRLINPLAHPRTLVVTLLFAAFLTIAYLTITLLGRVRWVEQDR